MHCFFSQGYIEFTYSQLNTQDVTECLIIGLAVSGACCA